MTFAVKVPITIDSSCVLPLFDRIAVHRSDTIANDGLPINFVEQTNVSTRLPILPKKDLYIYQDLTGNTDSFYKIQFFNSGTGAFTDLATSEANQVAELDPSANIITVSTLNNVYLFGIDLTDDAGTPYPDETFEFHISSAIAKASAMLGIEIAPRLITEERQDYYHHDQRAHNWVKLDHSPVSFIQRIQLDEFRSSGSSVNGDDVDLRTVRLDSKAGAYQLIGDIALFRRSSLRLSGYGGNPHWVEPSVFLVDYIAGFTKPPADIVDLVGKMAALQIFNIAGDLALPVGVASQTIGIDGLSQSINSTASATNAAFGARVTQYTKEVKDLIPALRIKYGPNELSVL